MFNDPRLNILLRQARKNFRLKVKGGHPPGEFGKNWRMCRKFKKDYANKRHEEKIARLKELAEVQINNKTSYVRRRAKKHHGNGKLCWVCRNRMAECQHHIIQIKNGGYDNGVNRIPICSFCHGEIHEWMEVEQVMTNEERENYENSVFKE